MRRLADRVVVTTRDGSPDDPLVTHLRQEGADVRVWPTLRFVPIRFSLDQPRYDWIVFTSARSVTSFVGAGHSLSSVQVAAVGDATEAAVHEAGGTVTIRGATGAAGLLDAMVTQFDLHDAHVLFPASDLAGPAVERTLTAAGARVQRVNVYRTITIPPDEKLVLQDLENGVDIITFASPSAVESLAAALQSHWPQVILGCITVAIGRTTAKSLRCAGVHRVDVASEPTVEGLVGSCVSAIQSRSDGALQ